MYLFIILGVAALLAIAGWRIFAKAGFSGWLGLLMVLPGANLLMLLILAFGEWPIHGELRQLRDLTERN